MSQIDCLKDKYVLVTGSSRGLGKALALEYAAKGCNIVLVGRDRHFLNRAEQELTRLHPGDHCVRPCDLSNINSVMELVNDKTLPSIDILVNCAGVFPINKIVDVSLEEYEHCIGVNVTAPFVLIKELSKSMIEKSWGRIINVASSSAYAGSATTSVYCASKHALLGLSRSLHKELKEHNIRVICVSPGSIKTTMGRAVEKLGQDFDTFIEPQEVAEYIVFNSSYDGNLVSEELRLNRMFTQ
jgi:3-oxoacyl-[acyl-carrier protein] reductase